MGRDANIRDGLDSHTSNVQRARSRRSFPNIAVHSDAVDLGNVPEGDRPAKETEDVTTSRATTGSVLVVW